MSKSSSPLRASAHPEGKVTGEADARLHGHSLTIVRVAWIAITVLMIGLTAAGLPAQYEQLTTPCQTTSCANEQLPREAVQALEAHGLSLTSYAVYDIAREVLFVSVWLAVAALIFWRRSSDRGALVVSFFLVTFGVGTFTDTLNALADAQPMFTSLVRSVEVLGVSFLAVALLLCPDGRFVPRWTGFLAVAFILLQIVGLLFPSSPLGQIDNGLFVLLFGTLFGTIILAQVYRYRRISGPVERQQTKWAVSGIVAALVGFFGLIGLTAIFPALARPGSLASILTESAFPGVMLLIPLSFGMAILRSRLWDIDLVPPQYRFRVVSYSSSHETSNLCMYAFGRGARTA